MTMNVDKPAIDSIIEVDASHILGFDCGSRSWIEATVVAFGPRPRDMIIGVGLMGGPGGPTVARYTSRKLLAEDGISVEGIERTEPDNKWWDGWLREADGVLAYLKEGRAQRVPKTE